MSAIMKVIAAVAVLAGILFASPSASAFNLFGDSCSGRATNSPACQQAAQQGTTDPIAGQGGIINKAANIIALITGIFAVIMIIIGGFTYVTSGGNPEKAAHGRRQVLYAVIAVVVVALAWTLTSFIMNLIG
jgi:hypothetical protein